MIDQSLFSGEETVCMNCETWVSGKNKKNIIGLSSAEITQTWP